MPGQRWLADWLRPEITGASRKIISICLGPGKVGRWHLRPRRKQPRPHPMHQLCPPPFPQAQLKLPQRQRAPTWGMGDPGAGPQAQGRGASGRPVWVLARRGGPVHAPGDPGRLLAAPALAAAQGVCGNDTARAAEIPPPDIGWKVEQLVRDNQWRSIAEQRGRTAWGRGGGAAEVGASAWRSDCTQTCQGGRRRRGVTRTHDPHSETSLGPLPPRRGTLTTRESHHQQFVCHRSRHNGVK